MYICTCIDNREINKKHCILKFKTIPLVDTVYFELNVAARVITFYVVESIDIFELMIQSASGTGVVSRKKQVVPVMTENA